MVLVDRDLGGQGSGRTGTRADRDSGGQGPGWTGIRAKRKTGGLGPGWTGTRADTDSGGQGLGWTGTRADRDPGGQETRSGSATLVPVRAPRNCQRAGILNFLQIHFHFASGRPLFLLRVTDPDPTFKPDANLTNIKRKKLSKYYELNYVKI